jgi:cell division protein FtsL
MTRQDFEFAIKKNVRNNPIIREVDRVRQRELWRSMAIGVFLVAVLLLSAWQHFELLQLGYQIPPMQQERASELTINRRLRLEIETLRAPERIERIATEQLSLIAPSSDEAVVIERVLQAPAPDRSIVATRQGEDTGEADNRR